MVHGAQLSRRRISAFEEVGRFVVANRGAQTPTPQMVSPPGDLFIRRDDSIYGLRGLILASGRSQNHQEDTTVRFFRDLDAFVEAVCRKPKLI